VSSGASKTCSARDERDARAAPRAVEARAWQRHAMDQQWSRVGERGQRTRARAASRRVEQRKSTKGARAESTEPFQERSAASCTRGRGVEWQSRSPSSNARDGRGPAHHCMAAWAAFKADHVCP
jgi:hypothetical protein